ncbi:winged helix-turn-helix domain-containing protein [Cellulosimicrobium arenosum]|uniref:YcaQ family DNA glycosylase n=1 Tax=Cellulosimicrobium arenosum TaxID=2708133 RepID=A0A927J2Y9_9MICO|nr:crosslink repair DNA glycosylase YcaQ family protein [Cellulosimicrobium arenosum]MBD8080715.1 YcaQ family DNA glycosylase [Cellulosimicrobium arenosum]
MSLAQARRVALAAQGLHRPRPFGSPGGAARAGAPTMRHVQGVIDRLGLLQIDSVNVLARAHLMPLYARIGPYDTGLLDRAAGRAPRRLVETWAHVASYVPPSTWPLLEWRRRRYRTEAWGSISSVEMSHSAAVEDVRRLVTERGPVTASEVHAILEAEGRSHPRDMSRWGWNWTVAKRALEFLFFTGEVTSTRRNAAFERCYDLTDRVLPPAVLALPPVADADAVRALLEIGARAHGVGTLRCFKDYFRIGGPGVRTALAELVDAGTLRPVAVRGWDEPTYLHADAVLPRHATATTLLNPFDPVVFERTRLERLFGVRYRIEIYVPAAKRVHGYYVLPFLEDGDITARVDLKADRRDGVLRVLSAHREQAAGTATAGRLAAELRVLGAWLGVPDVDVAPSGDLAPDLSAAVRGAG